MKIELSSSTVRREPGHLAVDAIHFRAHGVGDRHGVLARLLRHAQADAGLAVDAREGPQVLGRVLDLGDVLQVDRHALRASSRPGRGSRSRFSNWPWLRTRYVMSPSSISPSGMFWFSLRSRLTMRSTGRSSARIFSFDSST